MHLKTAKQHLLIRRFFRKKSSLLLCKKHQVRLGTEAEWGKSEVILLKLGFK